MRSQEYKFQMIQEEEENKTTTTQMHLQSAPAPIRVLQIGSSGVGKTSMMEKMINNTFPHNVSNDLQHIYHKQVDCFDDRDQKQQVTLEFIDPPHGANRFDDDIYDDIDCLIVMFSMCDRQSFDDICTKWMRYIEHRWKTKLGDMVLILIGTHNRVIHHVTQKDIRATAKYYQFDAEYRFDAQYPMNHQFNQILQLIASRYHQIQINKEASVLHTNIKCVDIFSNYYYDRLAVIISIFDLITDIIVMIQFFNDDKVVFFVLSVIILVLCQFAYANAFVVLFAMNHSPAKRTMTYFTALLIGPFISTLIWYILDKPHSLFVKHFLRDKLGFTVKLWNADGKHSAFAQWVRVKLKKHLGFLLQSILESAPQSILQMIAIVYYGNQPNVIAIISISLSMISIATKSIVFSRAIDIRTFIFNWFCCVVDFFSIFVTVSWVFYNVDHDNKPISSLSDFMSLFTVIGQIFWYKLFICVVPAVFIGVTGLCLYCGFVGIKENISFWKDYKNKRIEQYKDTMLALHLNRTNNMNNNRNDIKAPCTLKGVLLFQFICHQLGIILLIVVLCSCGVILGTVVAEMSCFTPIAFLLYTLIAIKFPHKQAADYDGWNDIFRFVSNYKDKHDRLLRIVTVQNMIYYLSFCGIKCEQFQIYLHQQETQSIPFKDATFSAIREQISFCAITMLKQYVCNLIEWIKEEEKWLIKLKIIGVILFCIVFVPIYILSRILNLLFPVIIFVYLGYFNLWSNTSMFQYFMLITYVLLLFIWILLANNVFILHHSMFHISLVAGNLLENTQNKYDLLLQNVRKYYAECINVEQRRHILWNQFGDDVGFAIDSYIQRFDSWNDEL